MWINAQLLKCFEDNMKPKTKGDYLIKYKTRKPKNFQNLGKYQGNESSRKEKVLNS